MGGSILSTNTEQLTVQVADIGSVTALIYPADKQRRSDITLILGHGAGGNQLSGFMRSYAEGLAKRGLDVMTFNFLYSEQKRGAPDPKGKLELCYQSVIETARRHRKLKNNHLAIGGKSMGGRIASQVSANGERKLAGLVFLGYPLHPPGKPEQLRDAHLKDVQAPMLFVQGSRDPFGTPTELRLVFKRLKLPATLFEIETGDHSFKVLKSLNVTQEQVHERAMDEIVTWLIARASN